MVRKMIQSGVFAALGVVAVMASYGVATSADEDTPDVSTIMKKSFGKGGYKASITEAAKSGDWDKAVALAKEWKELGEFIGKNKPPMGDEKSWKKQCAGFSKAAMAVLASAEKKDAKAVAKSLKGFNCGACHKAHKP